MTVKNRIGAFLFKNRSFTPIPLIILIFIFLKPSNYGELTPYISIAGLIIIIIGEGIRIISVGYSFPGTSGRESYLRADNLNTSGIYSMVRNPLYIGNILIYSGLLIAYSNLAALICFDIILIFQYFFIINYEEEFLKEKFGDKYFEYCKTSGRVVPKFSSFKKPVYRFNLLRVLFSENDSIFNSLFLYFMILLYKEKIFSGEFSNYGVAYIIFGIILIFLYIFVKITKKKRKTN